MLKQIKLYGELAEEYGKDWLLDVNSPSEAVRALCANNPSFRNFLTSSDDRGVGYKVMVGKTYIEAQEEIYEPSGRQEIKIIPVVLGAKKDGLGAILLGIALVVAAPYAASAIAAQGAIGGATLGASLHGTLAVGAGSGMAALGSMVSGAMMQIGWGLISGGIAQALATTPEEIKDDQNYSFNGAANTVSQGVPVPVCYGQLMIGGAVISSGITNENYSP
jgi:predicted phage tail protein